LRRNLLLRACVVVILSGDFTFLLTNHTFELRDESHFFSDLYGLSAAARAEFVEETARVGFDSVFTDEEFVGDLAVAETLCDQLEDLELTFRNAEILEALLIQGEGWCDCGHGDFFNNDDLRLFGQLQSEPDAESGEERGNEPAIDLDRVLGDEKAKLDQPEQDDQNPAAQAVDECVDKRLSLHRENRILTDPRNLWPVS